MAFFCVAPSGKVEKIIEFRDWSVVSDNKGMSESRSTVCKKCQNNLERTLQWKQNVKSLRSVLDSHEEIFAWSWVGMIEILPEDVIIIIIKKSAIELFPELLFALKECVAGLSLCVDKFVSAEMASTRQNAVFAMATVFCMHKKAAVLHIRATPSIHSFMLEFSRKLDELLSLYENFKTKNNSPSSVRWKQRHRQLLRVSDIWNNSIYFLETKDY